MSHYTEEAVRKAYDLDSACVCLCHSCADECEDAQIVEVTVEVKS